MGPTQWRLFSGTSLFVLLLVAPSCSDGNGPTDGDGRFKVRAASGKYHLQARSNLGGPLEEGEWYGTYRSPAGEESVTAVSDEEIRIEVSRYRKP